jgi:phosphoribosylaminoimidazolecarboxamide formyltransferase/IMP cyclohydrolase
MPRALFSVSNKEGIIEFGRTLSALGWDIVATSGTAQLLVDAGIQVTPVEQLTGLPEMLGGRVKTLHPSIHGAILARDNSQDMDELKKLGYAPIELVVSNLYPFPATVQREGVSLAEAVEQIDIGGVTLLRAAAKNFERVMVLVDPADYPLVQQALLSGNKLSLKERQELAVKTFAHTQQYDAAIHAYLSGKTDILSQVTSGFPDSLTLSLRQSQALRYGENPHQRAGVFILGSEDGLLGGELLQGKALSYNNLLDADAAWRAVSSFDPAEHAAVVIVKHLNPTGIAIGGAAPVAFKGALASDPISAFGGVVALNVAIDESFVDALGSLFVEVLIAADFSEGACQKLAETRKNCRLLKITSTEERPGFEFRSVTGGFLLQQRDTGDPPDTDWQVVSERQPSAEELRALRFAWKACQHVKSNAIVLAHETATVGIGGGLPSRIDATRLAIEKAGERAAKAVLGSDAFFPFADGVMVAAEAGVRAIIQPGGSIRDQEVIEAVNEAGMAMVFTGVRHFRH